MSGNLVLCVTYLARQIKGTAAIEQATPLRGEICGGFSDRVIMVWLVLVCAATAMVRPGAATALTVGRRSRCRRRRHLRCRCESGISGGVGRRGGVLVVAVPRTPAAGLAHHLDRG